MIGDDDIAEFFDPDEFAVPALYARIGQYQKTVNGIFIPAGQDIMLQDTALEALKPQFICATADVPDLRRNDTFVISSVTYYAGPNNPDGTGVTTIQLSLDRYGAK